MNQKIEKTKVNKDQNDEGEVKSHPKLKSNKKQNIVEKPNKKIDCSSCKQRSWIEVDKGYRCQNCEFIIKKQKQQTD